MSCPTWVKYSACDGCIISIEKTKGQSFHRLRNSDFCSEFGLFVEMLRKCSEFGLLGRKVRIWTFWGQIWPFWGKSSKNILNFDFLGKKLKKAQNWNFWLIFWEKKLRKYSEFGFLVAPYVVWCDSTIDKLSFFLSSFFFLLSHTHENDYNTVSFQDSNLRFCMEVDIDISEIVCQKKLSKKIFRKKKLSKSKYTYLERLLICEIFSRSIRSMVRLNNR